MIRGLFYHFFFIMDVTVLNIFSEGFNMMIFDIQVVIWARKYDKLITFFQIIRCHRCSWFCVYQSRSTQRSMYRVRKIFLSKTIFIECQTTRFKTVVNMRKSKKDQERIDYNVSGFRVRVWRELLDVRKWLYPVNQKDCSIIDCIVIRQVRFLYYHSRISTRTFSWIDRIRSPCCCDEVNTYEVEVTSHRYRSGQLRIIDCISSISKFQTTEA